MTRHQRDLRLPTFPRPYPLRRPSRPVAPERLQPLLLLVLLLQCLTLLLLVAWPAPGHLHSPGLPSISQPGFESVPDNQATSSTLFRGLIA
ncbi:MAG: hypothetical protein NTV57_11155 [Cyanobacteria bacterium]|nr:hypothetical protein [Cyanobacteriota bacterium]